MSLAFVSEYVQLVGFSQLLYGRTFLSQFHLPVGGLNTDIRLCSRGSLL